MDDDMLSDDLSIGIDDESGFYLNWVDAACHGALFQMGDDDGGLDFYI